MGGPDAPVEPEAWDAGAEAIAMALPDSDVTSLRFDNVAMAAEWPPSRGVATLRRAVGFAGPG